MGVLLALVLGLQDAPGAVRTLIVHMRDGSTLPLKSWTLSIEYETWPQGEGPTSATISRKESQSLILGKKEYPLSGVSSVELEYVGKAGEGSSPVRVVTLHARGGEVTKVRFEPPARELLFTGKGKVVVPRSLDLVGETILGTKKDLCLLSYSSLVECGSDPEDQVQSLQFTE